MELALPTAETPILTVTAQAAAKIEAYASSNPKETAGKNFRVYIQGGGCSGFEYKFAFDEKKDGDNVVQAGGLNVLVDEMTLPYVKGSVVDYIDDFGGSGFSVKNPNATSTCGCGTSFSV